MNRSAERDFRIDDHSTALSIAQGISDYYLYVLAGIGIPANVLAIATVLTMNVVTPATFFVASLSACDGLALVFKLVFSKLGGFNAILCKLEFLPVFFTIMANWMLVFICAERFISVFFPQKKAQLVTRRKSYISVGLTGIVLFVTLGSLFTIMRTYMGSCGTFQQYSYFWRNVWLYALGNTLAVFLPFLCIFVLTVAIIRGLRVSSTYRRSLMIKDATERSSNNESQSTNERQTVNNMEILERRITVMMTFTAVYFLVFSLPSCVFYCLEIPESSSGLVKYLLFGSIQYILLDSTHALNFFLYVLTFKGFRWQLVHLLTCKIFREDGPTLVSNTQTSSIGLEHIESQE